jgi:hypothetical protein
VHGAETVFAPSKDQTSEDLPLKFVAEKSKMSETGSFEISGTIKNTGNITYRQVKVIFTAFDSSGKVLGRNSWYAEPSTIKPNQVGYIEEKFVSVEGRKPAKVEWSIIGLPD